VFYSVFDFDLALAVCSIQKWVDARNGSLYYVTLKCK